MKQQVKIIGEIQRDQAKAYLNDIPLEPVHVVDIRPITEKRTLDQNAKLWPMLHDVSTQVCWHGRYLDASDWKNILTAALRGYESVPNIDGTGFVVLGMSTSKLPKRVFCDLIELIYAFGSDKRVVWSEKAQDYYERYRK